MQVFEKLKQAEVTSKEIEAVRDGYRPAARRGAGLFFVLSEMSAINSMQFCCGKMVYEVS